MPPLISLGHRHGSHRLWGCKRLRCGQLRRFTGMPPPENVKTRVRPCGGTRLARVWNSRTCWCAFFFFFFWWQRERKLGTVHSGMLRGSTANFPECQSEVLGGGLDSLEARDAQVEYEVVIIRAACSTANVIPCYLPAWETGRQRERENINKHKNLCRPALYFSVFVCIGLREGKG